MFRALQAAPGVGQPDHHETRNGVSPGDAPTQVPHPVQKPRNDEASAKTGPDGRYVTTVDWMRGHDGGRCTKKIPGGPS